MAKAANRLHVRQLDTALARVRAPISKIRRPKAGWIRAIRNGLGMSAAHIAKQLGVSEANVLLIEARERDDRVTLKTLREVAEIMDCDLRYFLVPRKSLEDTIRAQAELVAKKNIQRIAHTMALEDQPMSRHAIRVAIAEQVDELIRNPPRNFWAGGRRASNSQQKRARASAG